MWWQAAAVLGGTGLALGAGLAYVAVKVAVPADPLVTAVKEQLPGANCGACGYPGCDGLASALAKGQAPITACPAGGPAVAEALAKVLGLEAVAMEAKVVAVHCMGTPAVALELYKYEGIKDCRAAAMMPGGGPKACQFGCVGLGTCSTVCPFGALSMDGETNLPVVDREKCTACGVCVTACPKSVLSVVPKSQWVYAACNNKDKGLAVKKICSVGCMGCGLCVRACPQKTIVMTNNLAVVNAAGCDGCGTCVSKCNPKSIAVLVPLPEKAVAAEGG